MALGTGIVRSARIVSRMRAIPVVACASVSRLARMRANGALLFARVSLCTKFPTTTTSGNAWV